MYMAVAFFFWQLTISKNDFQVAGFRTNMKKTQSRKEKNIVINMIKFLMHQSVASHRYVDTDTRFSIFYRTLKLIWVFPKIGVPQNGWFIMENPY